MKIPHVAGLVMVSVLITVAIEESRIALLRSALKTEVTDTAAPPAATAGQRATNEPDNTPSVRKKPRPETSDKPSLTNASPKGESFAKTMRKMWDNPAGKSMMNQQIKIAVAMMYEDFVQSLDLTKEEADYFKNLLGRGMGDQKELGMKMMGASAEERKALTAELSKRVADNAEEIKKFLNNDEDYKHYTDYKERLPERQQLDGIRSTLASKGVPMDVETESQLVEAMFRARTEAKVPDLKGPEAIDMLAKGNMVEVFEKNWEAQQELLHAETSKILSAEQQAAFQEFQQQTKEMQMMGLKMAEKMVPPDGNDSK